MSVSVRADKIHGPVQCANGPMSVLLSISTHLISTQIWVGLASHTGTPMSLLARPRNPAVESEMGRRQPKFSVFLMFSNSFCFTFFYIFILKKYSKGRATRSPASLFKRSASSRAVRSDASTASIIATQILL